MAYHLNRLDGPVFIAVSKPLLTEFYIHHRLESCDGFFYLVLNFAIFNQIFMENSDRAVYSDLNPRDGGQSLYPMCSEHCTTMTQLTTPSLFG